MELQKALDLHGRTALVTGGGSGIGRGCALALAQAGAKVCISGRRMEKLESVQDEIVQAGGICICHSADLTREDSCKELVDDCVSRFGQLDIVVNSAGSRGAHGGLEEELSTENLRETMAADFDATFFVIKYAWPYCVQHEKGSIINIASLAALQARGPVIYSAAKGAVRSFSRSLAKRLGEKQVRVNTIYPGFIVTEMTQGVTENPELEAHFRKESPLGALGAIEDIAYCAVYLASDAARFITGQDFVIDGGATC